MHNENNKEKRKKRKKLKPSLIVANNEAAEATGVV